jgi:adenosine kinase
VSNSKFNTVSNPTILICGSIAYDSIMVFEGHFKDHILPDQIHALNVAFLVPTLRKQWGGCAGNIAYGLKLLGGNPLPMATIGSDGADYLQRFHDLGIATRCIRSIEECYTAQAFITTDLNDNQITAFHPGAMMHAHTNSIHEAGEIALAIVAPDGRQGMLNHAQNLANAGIPFIFDPGQGLPMFNGEELLGFLDQATYATVNDYEAKLLCDKTGLSLEQLAQRVQALVVTRGAEGSWVFTKGEQLHIPSISCGAVVDPTGCGDAFRAGLLYGLTNDMDWPTTARLASTMGGVKITHRGGQTYAPSREEIAHIFKSHFTYNPW